MKIYLYIKTHNVTGLKYFGKTTNKDPIKYKGSGKYWKQHIKKHGNNVSTEIYGCFDNEELCMEAALQFSKNNNIISSDLWANLIDENGQDGAPVGHRGHIFTNEQKEKIAQTSKGRWEDNAYRDALKNTHKQRHINNPTLASNAAYKAIEKQKLNGTYESAKIARSNGLKNYIDNLSEVNKEARSAKLKMPKSEEHKQKIAQSHIGLKKTKDHIRLIAISKQINKDILIDHNGESYELHSDFLAKYNLPRSFLFNLDQVITKPTLAKLNLDYVKYKGKTKRELGFSLLPKDTNFL